MARAATMEEGAALAPTEAKAKPVRRAERIDNERDETMRRYLWVLMMPLVIAINVALIVFYLTLPLR